MNQIIFETIIKITITGSVFFIQAFLLSLFTKKILSSKWHFEVSKICMFLFIAPISLIVGSKLFPKSEIMSIYSFDIANIAYSSFNYVNLFIIVWFIGFMLFIVINSFNYFRFKRIIGKFDSKDQKLDEILQNHVFNENYKVSIQRNSNVKSPMLIGIRKPVIRIPEYLNDYDELNLIIGHELIHYKRKDLLIKIINIFIMAINWFNPLIYVVNKNVNRWCEISCDELLVKSKEKFERKLYGNLLLKVIENVDNEQINDTVVYLGLCSESKYIKNRLYIILNSKKSSIIRKVFSFIILFTLAFESIGISTFATTKATYKVKSFMGGNFSYDNMMFNDFNVINNNITSSDEYVEMSVSIDNSTGKIGEINKDY